MSSLRKLIGLRIKAIRKIRGLTQEDLGERAGLQYTYIGGIERGERNISLDSLDNILSALDISAVDLLKLDDINIDQETLEKNDLLKLHKELLNQRDIEVIKMIHRITRDILTTFDMKGMK
ncbi:helix-turn-helix transcriptional regulator, partial [Bacillus thuringiensis]|nr:helix-turn-helix transcriptional regulator [Bacillus thuringiensis]